MGGHTYYLDHTNGLGLVVRARLREFFGESSGCVCFVGLADTSRFWLSLKFRSTVPSNTPWLQTGLAIRVGSVGSR